MSINLGFYWQLLIKRLPVMTALVVLCTTLSIATALRLPETFTTSARMLVEAPQIRDDDIQSNEVDAAEQLQVIEQRLMTRANLLEIANRFDVLDDLSEMDPDQVVEAMVERTQITRSSGRNEATLMTLSFEAKSAQVVASVVNEYVTIVLEDNARDRQNRTGNTLNFFEQQVEQLGQQLDQQSVRIVEFKNTNNTALPDDQEYRLGRQALLQERLSRLERDKDALDSQREQMIAIANSTGETAALGGVQTTPEQARLNEKRQELEQALLIYSDTNPRVRLLKGQVAQLESVVGAQISGSAAGGSAESVGEPASLLDVTLVEMQSRIASMAQEITETTAELESLNAAIAATPANGIALDALERDYANTQALYNSAVGSLSQARMSNQIEAAGQSQRISVIENAAVPTQPSGPNRTRIIILGVIAGFMLAGGVFFLLELFNRAIRRPAELTSRFGITPLTVIPYMESSSSRMMRRGALIAAFLMVLVGVPTGLWAIDTYYLPLELLADRFVAKLGFS